jgi:hypothetical protein
MNVTTICTFNAAVVNKERPHRLRVKLAWVMMLALILAVSIYGFDYYRLSKADRPFSAKHTQLRPSGQIGVKLGILGLAMFGTLFLYPLRKRVRWLSKVGNSRHWLDFHVVIGSTAPIIIAFHSSFKFRGIAGMAFWIMVAVAISGIVGRYIYAQIPRSLNSAELSLKELEAMGRELTEQLSAQKVVSPDDLAPLFRLPSPERVRRESALLAILTMLMLDLARPFKVAWVRAKSLSFGAMLLALGGLLPTGNRELEDIVQLAKRKSSLSKRVVFLARTQQVFHLWHVIHRPFSYSFAVLVVLHIVVVMLLGYM